MYFHAQAENCLHYNVDGRKWNGSLSFKHNMNTNTHTQKWFCKVTWNKICHYDLVVAQCFKLYIYYDYSYRLSEKKRVKAFHPIAGSICIKSYKVWIHVVVLIKKTWDPTIWQRSQKLAGKCTALHGGQNYAKIGKISLKQIWKTSQFRRVRKCIQPNYTAVIPVCLGLKCVSMAMLWIPSFFGLT